jgi:hypothetical protein
MGCFCPVLVNQCNLHWQNEAESTQFTDECKKGSLGKLLYKIKYFNTTFFQM